MYSDTLVAMEDKPQVIQVVEAAQKLSDEELRQVLGILSNELK
jgi:transcription initiation factor IIE alpha subunit